MTVTLQERLARPFKWTPASEMAAILFATPGMTTEAIARETGRSTATLEKWKLHDEFKARVRAITSAEQDAVIKRGVAERQNRIDALNDRWLRMNRLIQARSESMAAEAIPGGETGLLVRRVRTIQTGRLRDTEVEYELDAALLRELRETEKQAAQELGQWSERHETAATVVIREYAGFDPGAV